MQGYDIMEEMYSPKSAASNFLHELCEARQKNLDPFMQQVKAEHLPSYRLAAYLTACEVPKVQHSSALCKTCYLATLQISAIFTEQQAAAAVGGPVPQQIARRMDGALLAVGALSDILKHKVCHDVKA
jgi:importin-7